MSVLACGGRAVVFDESANGGASSAPPSAAGSGAGGSRNQGGADGFANAGRGAAEDAGIDASLNDDGGEVADASDSFDAGPPSEPFDAGTSLWDTQGVVNPSPDQGVESSSCGQCAASEVCHPGVGCEPACDIPTGLDPNAAWPIGGGCATRRGLSRYSGLKQPTLAFSIALGSNEATYSSAITLGENREIYVGGQANGAFGFLRIDRDGAGLFYSDWLGEVPVLGQNGVLYTVPSGLQATRRDGTVLWSLPGGYGHPGPFDQSGEPVIGADGTIYSAGGFDNDTGLFAVSSAGQILWSVRTNSNVGMDTWPAIAKDGTVYFEASNGMFWAMSPSGKQLWRFPTGEYGSGFPAVDHAQNVYISNGEHLWSLAPGGQLRWRQTVPISSGAHFEFGHLAIGPDGTVFAPFFEQNGDSFENGAQAYSSDGEPLWTYHDAGYAVSTPVVDRDGILYLTTANTLHAFSSTGSELWSTQIPGDNGCQSVVLGADGTTFVKCREFLSGFQEGAM